MGMILGAPDAVRKRGVAEALISARTQRRFGYRTKSMMLSSWMAPVLYSAHVRSNTDVL